MLAGGDREYHVERARQELELACQAKAHVAADAHLRLSELHMARLKEPDEICSGDVSPRGLGRR